MAKKQKGVVGIVGLGIMGGAFAQNLHAAGWRVLGYDTDPQRRRALGRAGMATAADIAAERLPRRVVIEASTFKLEDKQAAEAVLRKAGHVLLDCPVSGTGLQAQKKDLVIYASGGSAEI